MLLSRDYIDLPSGWNERSEQEQRGSSIVEFQRQTAGETTSIVSIYRRPEDSDRFTLRLSTIEPISIRNILHRIR